jgi:hypothetical protein
MKKDVCEWSVTIDLVLFVVSRRNSHTRSVTSKGSQPKRSRSASASRSQAAAAPGRIKDDESDSADIVVRPEDRDFVQGLSSDQLRFFTSSGHLDEAKTPLLEAQQAGLAGQPKDETVKPRVEVDAMRPMPRDWETEAHSRALLPIRKKDGTVALPAVTAEDVEERQRLEERREARKAQAAVDAASGQSKRRRKLGDPEQEEPVVAAVVEPQQMARAAKEEELASLKAFQERLDRIPDKQAEIETLCKAVLGNPDQHLGENGRLLLALCVDEDAVVKQLALLSAAAVFADLMPGYRIREDNEERADEGVKLSKDVKKLRRHERVYLHAYRQFVDLIVGILALRKPNPATPEETALYESAQKPRRFHVKTVKALHQLQVIAAKCMSRVLLSNPSFNYAESWVKVLVPAADRVEVAGGAMSKVAVQTIVKVFEQRNELEQISELVLEIGRYVKARKFVANPDLLRTFLQVSIGDGVSDIDIKNATDRGGRKAKTQPHVSKREKKVRKFGKMVDNK